MIAALQLSPGLFAGGLFTAFALLVFALSCFCNPQPPKNP